MSFLLNFTFIFSGSGKEFSLVLLQSIKITQFPDGYILNTHCLKATSSWLKHMFVLIDCLQSTFFLDLSSS